MQRCRILANPLLASPASACDSANSGHARVPPRKLVAFRGDDGTANVENLRLPTRWSARTRFFGPSHCRASATPHLSSGATGCS